MDQKKAEKTAGRFIKVTLGVVVAVMSVMALSLWQEWKKMEAAEQAEKVKEQEKEQKRRGGTADHIELADSSVQEGPEGFTLRSVTYYSYDAQGRCTAVDQYDSDGKLHNYEHYAYDVQGNLILEQSETPGLRVETYDEVHFTYDEENRLTLKQHYDGDVLSSEHFYRYMSDGSTYLVAQYYDDKGQKGSWYAEVFNENEDPVSVYHYDEEDQVANCKLYRYDEEGRQIYFIYYNKGDETTKPLREVFTEYEADQTVRLTYEPLGHLNSAHYVRTDGNTKTEMYYLAGYSGGSGGDEIYILGQEEPKWNRKLKFSEGIWETYDGENKVSSLHCSYDRIHSYTACWYEKGNKVKELEYAEDEGIGFTTMKRYVYNADDTLAECYEYRRYLENSEEEPQAGTQVFQEELQDGTRICLEYSDNVTLTRLLCTNAEGTVLREITYDADGRNKIVEWYEPLKEQLWAEALIPSEDGIVPADQAEGAEQAEGKEQAGSSEEDAEKDWGENRDEISFPCYYAVQKGDSLWKIAERVYGDPYQFVIIYKENREVIGPDWNFIPAGMLLLLPEPDIQEHE